MIAKLPVGSLAIGLIGDEYCLAGAELRKKA